MGEWRRALIVASVLLFGCVGPAITTACEPYTLADEEDWFRLDDGVQWAFAGEVTEETFSAEYRQTSAVVIRVSETVAGEAAGRTLRIELERYCDPFYYKRGDEVIAAIGSRPGVNPPYRGITSYEVAVWVVRDGLVLNDGHRPWIAGIDPKSEAQLRALLRGLPDTATEFAASSRQRPARTSASLLALAAAAVVAALYLRVRRASRP